MDCNGSVAVKQISRYCFTRHISRIARFQQGTSIRWKSERFPRSALSGNANLSKFN